MWIMSVIYFSPVYRPAMRVGRPLGVLRSLARRSQPAYDIEKTAKDAYRVTLAVPGFHLDDLAVTARPNELVVTGKHVTKVEDHLRQGVVGQSFERRFGLDDHVEVIGASLANGLLTIDLQRRAPTAAQPRKIVINGKSPKPTLIEQARQVAASARDAVARWFVRGRSPRSAA
jgi:molecular chaperone IbpA